MTLNILLFLKVSCWSLLRYLRYSQNRLQLSSSVQVTRGHSLFISWHILGNFERFYRLLRTVFCFVFRILSFGRQNLLRNIRKTLSLLNNELLIIEKIRSGDRRAFTFDSRYYQGLVLCLCVVIEIRFVECLNEMKQIVDLSRLFFPSLHANEIVQAVRFSWNRENRDQSVSIAWCGRKSLSKLTHLYWSIWRWRFNPTAIRSSWYKIKTSWRLKTNFSAFKWILLRICLRSDEKVDK